MTSNLIDSKQLRPYYDHDSFNAGYSVIFKKDVGLIDTTTNKPITANLSTSNIDKVINNSGLILKSFGRTGTGSLGINSNATTGGVVSATARNSGDKNYIYDLEFNEYFDLHNLSELFKNLVWNFIKNYMKVLISQPLEIVRLVLQVGKFEFDKPRKLSTAKSKRLLDDNTNDVNILSRSFTSDEDNEDEEEINYFQPNLEQQVWSNQNSMQQDANASPLGTTTSSTPMPIPTYKSSSTLSLNRKKSKYHKKITPKSIHTVDILTSIINKDGPFALFRGINASFIYQTLSRTIEAWITGFVSPFLGVPDPFFLDLTHSNDPFRSLWLSVSACVLTGLVLMPLDLIRVKLMLTQFTTPIGIEEDEQQQETEENNQLIPTVSTRSVRESIRNFPLHYLSHPPWPIVCLTILHQFSTSIFRKAAPYILFIKFNIDSYSLPNVYTFVNLISLIMEFFIKLPVENLLRKAQLGFLLLSKSHDSNKVITITDENLIVEYNSGGVDEECSLWERVKSLGLFNGWRVGVLNVIGFWGYNILKNDGTELKEEKL